MLYQEKKVEGKMITAGTVQGRQDGKLERSPSLSVGRRPPPGVRLAFTVLKICAVVFLAAQHQEHEFFYFALGEQLNLQRTSSSTTTKSNNAKSNGILVEDLWEGQEDVDIDELSADRFNPHAFIQEKSNPFSSDFSKDNDGVDGVAPKAVLGGATTATVTEKSEEINYKIKPRQNDEGEVLYQVMFVD